ncbi:unnamed protein product [Citrullus colocynthis]|uniref:Uncharacterized protein n=1 Tax=Citrullus colocynthis TaxID=252529 RepID=A0ABP0Z1A0_9ROSI
MRGLNREKLHCTATICKCPKTTFDLQRHSEKLPVGDQGQLGHCIMGKRKTCNPPPLQKTERERRKLPGFWGRKGDFSNRENKSWGLSITSSSLEKRKRRVVF